MGKIQSTPLTRLLEDWAPNGGCIDSWRGTVPDGPSQSARWHGRPRPPLARSRPRVLGYGIRARDRWSDDDDGEELGGRAVMSAPIGPEVLGTAIRIYLASGGADGVWVVEKSNWTGKALMASRSRYADLRARVDLEGPGVYVLVGPPDGGALASRIYVGETDDLPARLDSHQRSKDFWTKVVVFTSKDANLNKAHIRYLEGRLIGLARAAARAELENGNVGSMPRLSEADQADAESFLHEMLLIYPVLGITVFQRAQEQQSRTGELHLSGKGATATGTETSEGFVVHAGARARIDHVPSIHGYGLQLRELLIDNGLLVADGDALRLIEDYVFTSPSTAAMVFMGRAANGRQEWKAVDGRSLKELQNADTGDAP